MLCFQVCNITRWWQFPPIGNGRNRCNVSLNLDNPKSMWIYKKYYKVIMICLCTSCIKYRNDSGNLVHYRWNSRCLCMSTLGTTDQIQRFRFLDQRQSAGLSRASGDPRAWGDHLWFVVEQSHCKQSLEWMAWEVMNRQMLSTIQGISGYNYSTILLTPNTAYQSPFHSLTTKMYDLYTHKLHRITADLDFFCNQLSWVCYLWVWISPWNQKHLRYI